MKLKKFRIKNYKSIIDSGDCYLSDTVTILAGKNESGKTSILEALRDFDTEVQIKDEVIPIDSSGRRPEISVTFSVEADTIERIFKEIDQPLKESADVEIEIIKAFSNHYSISKETWKKEIFGGIDVEKLHKSFIRKLEKINDNELVITAAPVDSFHFRRVGFTSYKSGFETFKDMMIQKLQEADEASSQALLKQISVAEHQLNDIENLFAVEEKFFNSLERYIPHFVLFSSFDDVFPNKIPFAEFDEDKWIKDLSVISDLDINKIRNSADREKRKHKNDLNIRLKDDYKKFWTQDVSNLSVDCDSNFLQFWIEEGGHSYEPNLRSKGRQWHLAFYIKISARSKENVPNIILIDEPGLFLHAKAQKDILRKLEDAAKEVQLIFSTHSSYLLEADRLSRVRLVCKTEEEGTKIENKVHALADKETLTPILTAIGLELNAGISGIDKANNAIVEGPSDVYYLNAFKNLLNKDGVNFIFGGGAGNMPFIGTILHGWGLRVIYLYDNDQGKRDGEKNLQNNWLVQKDLILPIMEEEGGIEDIFSPDDFKEFVLMDKNKTYSVSNSEYAKKNKLDKVLLAKKFLESCQDGASISLSKDTMKRISELIERIEKKF